MIEFLKGQISSLASNEDKINKLREILQLISLKVLGDKGCFTNIAFLGGTALRVLYDMRRFSEDLDFAVIDSKKYDFLKITSQLKREFNLYGLEIEASPRIKKTVQSSMLKFPGLLKKMGISNIENQKLSIKLEVDSNPPRGWKIEDTMINKTYVLNITHFDLPSLYATKLHACFFRQYIKGRDFYDLAWYLGKKVKPNYALLNNAIMQTEGKNPKISESNIKAFLLGKVEKINFKDVKKDVERFLEDKEELKFLDKTIISKGIEDTF